MNTGIILFSNSFLKNFSQVRMRPKRKKSPKYIKIQKTTKREREKKKVHIKERKTNTIKYYLKKKKIKVTFFLYFYYKTQSN